MAEKTTPERRSGRWASAGVVILLGILAVVVLVWPHLTAPREALCPQGAVLEKAAMLNRSRAVYVKAGAEGNDCRTEQTLPKSPLEAVESELSNAEKSFTIARARNAAGKAAGAIHAYIAGLERNPFNAPAILGLSAALKKAKTASFPPAHGLCKISSKLIHAGLLKNAHVSLGSALKKEGESCGGMLVKLSERSAQAAALSRSASRLAREDKTPEARDGYANALLRNSGLSAPRIGLEDSIDEESRLDAIGAWLEGIPATLKNALSWFVPLAIGLLIVAIVLWILVRALSARAVWARSLFERIGKHRPLFFLKNAAVPTVSVEPFDGGGASGAEGKDFSNLLSAAMGEQAGREPAFPFDRVSSGSKLDTGFASTVVEALTEVPETKLLGSVVKVLGKLFRRRSIVLSGRLISVGDEGAGVLLTMEENGKEHGASITLWETAFDPVPGGEASSRWLRMVPAAGVWARWQLAAALTRPKKVVVDSWLPDALFRSAFVWQTKRDLGRAEALYTGTLEKDPDLLPAAHNLAVIEIYEGNYERAEERLTELRIRLEKLRKGSGKLWPALGTSSLYSLVLAVAYPQVVSKAGPNRRLDEALAKSKELVGKLTHLIEEGPTGLGEEGEPLLSASDFEELKVAELPSVVLRASLMLRQDPNQRVEATRALADRSNVTPLTRKDLCERLAGLKAWQLIHGYVEKQPNLSRRAHYNLACYYTTLAEYAGGGRDKCFDLALTSLKAAVVGGEIRDWAGRDPSLKLLRDEKAAKFNEALASHPIAVHPSDATKTSDDSKAAVATVATLREIFEQNLTWLGKQIGI